MDLTVWLPAMFLLGLAALALLFAFVPPVTRYERTMTWVF